MLFNSYIFIFLFLPCVIAGYFSINKNISNEIGKIFLLIASIIFYTFAGYKCFLILVCSCLINYVLTAMINKTKYHKEFLIIGLIFNIGLLFYFKYYNFFVESLNQALRSSISEKSIILPLGISFYVFQQISYLVSVYKKEIKYNNLKDYLLYILFFPKLLMGPLIAPNELMKQFNDEDRKVICWDNVVVGLQLFSIGLFKKVIVADTFSKAVTWGFSAIANTTSADFFIVMLSYTFQIYFDFSGYSDMAIGVARMINIDLPINFDSPYKSMSIREFWKKWHMSLTKFFTEKIYIPLGGNRRGNLSTYINTIVVFVISGIWHGANWTFVLWGFLHGIANVIDRIVKNKWNEKHPAIRWMVTFFTINVLWLLFRANSVSEWIMLLKHMFIFNDMSISPELINCFMLPESDFIFKALGIGIFTEKITGFMMWLFLFGAIYCCLGIENIHRRNKKNTLFSALLVSVLMTWSVLYLSLETKFLYWDF